MSKKRHGANLEYIYCVDLEGTCFSTPEEQGIQWNEIIEIGIVKLHLKSGEITDKHSYAVRPQHSTVSAFCTELTGWTQEKINEADTIDEVLERLNDELKPTKDDIWVSFGEYDRLMLSSDPAHSSGVFAKYSITRAQNPFARMRAHINIKTVMAMKEKFSQELGMARALKFYGEELEGQHHSGADDAYNIAKIVRHVLS
jgi:inhibitor of KinA sporulation pathway (predicted exonuclease)